MTDARSDLDDLAAGVLSGDRARLARAITLVESARPEDEARAQDLLARILPRTGGAHRVGLSGVPGVGKSTLVETLGARLVDAGHRVGVLAVDPSSTLSGGSILGDKSRMPSLARSDAAFVRPSPSAASLGGVARRTRETMLLLEAAGFDVILVETVGVGQSEVAVADMVDTFVVLLLPGAGDELQGVKRGILELADVVAVNKADGDGAARARTAVREHVAALRYARTGGDRPAPPVLAVSARTGDGVDELWESIRAHRDALEGDDALAARRAAQQGRWMWSLVEERLLAAFRAHPDVRARLAALEADVTAGRVPATAAARELLERFLGTDVSRS